MTKAGIKHISYWDLFKNSIKYALSDWVAILIFGVILLILSNFEYYVLVNYKYLLSKRLIVASLLVIFLSMLESGYSFKILEESIKGSKKPPLFSNYNEMLQHGLKDTLVVVFYLSIIVFIIFVAILIDKTFPNEIFIISILAIFFGGYVFLYMLGALLNLAYNEGEFKSAFDFKTIKQMLKKWDFLEFW